jgi:hypothetical protein
MRLSKILFYLKVFKVLLLVISSHIQVSDTIIS